MNCWKFVKFVNIFLRQNFVPYGIELVSRSHAYQFAAYQYPYYS